MPDQVNPADPAGLVPLLGPLELDPSVKRAAWNHFYEAQTPDELKTRLDSVPELTPTIKRSLWYAKYPEAAKFSPAAATDGLRSAPAAAPPSTEPPASGQSSAPNTGPPIDPANPSERLPSPTEAQAQAQGFAKAYVDSVIAKGAPAPPNAIEQNTLGQGLNVGRGDAAMGMTAADFGGAGGKAPTPPGEFQDALSAWGSKVFPRLPANAPIASKTANAVGRVLTNFVSPDSLGTMMAFSTAGEALPALANLPAVAAKLKDLPTVLKALDVAAAAAVPVAVASKTAADLAKNGVPKNYEDAVETAVNTLIMGAGLFSAVKAGRDVLKGYPESAPGPSAAETKLAEQTGGIAGRIKPEVAAKTATTLEAGGRRLAASQWQKIADNNPVDLGGGRELQFGGMSASGRQFFQVVDKDGKVLVGGPQSAVSAWLDQQRITKPSSEAGGSVSVGGGAAEPGELRQVEKVGQTNATKVASGEQPNLQQSAAESAAGSSESPAAAERTPAPMENGRSPALLIASIRGQAKKAAGTETEKALDGIADHWHAGTIPDELKAVGTVEQVRLLLDHEEPPAEPSSGRLKGSDRNVPPDVRDWRIASEMELTDPEKWDAAREQVQRLAGYEGLDRPELKIHPDSPYAGDDPEELYSSSLDMLRGHRAAITAATTRVNELSETPGKKLNAAKKALELASQSYGEVVDEIGNAFGQDVADHANYEATKKGGAVASPPSEETPGEPLISEKTPETAASAAIAAKTAPTVDELVKHYTDNGLQPAPGSTATPEEIRAGAELAIEQHNAKTKTEGPAVGESAPVGRANDSEANVEAPEAAGAVDVAGRSSSPDTGQPAGQPGGGEVIKPGDVVVFDTPQGPQRGNVDSITANGIYDIRLPAAGKKPARSVLAEKGQIRKVNGEAVPEKVPGTVQEPEIAVESSHAAEPAAENGISAPVAAGDADQEALGGVPAEDVSGAATERQAPAGRARSPRTYQGSAVRPGSKTERAAQPGLGNGAPGVGLPAERGGSADAELRPGKPARPTPADSDYRIADTDRVGEGTPREKQRANLDAIRILKTLQAENRPATDEEKKTLVRYSGWGAHAQIFDQHRYEHREIREALRELLTPEEYASIRATTPNAHYTAPDVIHGMWDAVGRLGFRRGRVLEPSLGVGHFFGLTPSDLIQGVSRTGVEIDPITAGIAKALYPASDIQAVGLEKTSLPDNFYDLAIGNVPFGDYGVYDPKLKAPRSVMGSIHNYFFAKALDKVRPGGIVAFITSSFTMDRKDSTVRHYLAGRADLVGAIRLPSSAFTGNAGTDVTTDIIFLKKRAEGEAAAGEAWEKIADAKGRGGVDVQINEYYAAHPEMMLGQMSIERGSYAEMQRMVGEFSAAKLAEAVDRLPENILKPFKAAKKADEGIREEMDADQRGLVKQGAFAVKDGKLFVREGDELAPVGIGREATARVVGMMRVRDAVRDVFRSQLNEEGDKKIAEARARLGSVYDVFVKKYGFLSERANSKAFMDDPDSPLLLSLEHWDDEKQTATKAKIFTERTLAGRYRPVEKADTPAEALAIALNETGVLDFERMGALTGLEPEELQRQLGELIYKNPDGERWETADEYLSGNVRDKLRKAEAAARVDATYERNVTELKAVQPADLPPGDIAARLGSPWIPGADVARFVREEVTQGGEVSVFYSPTVGQWSLNLDKRAEGSAGNKTTWAAGGLNGDDLIVAALNLKIPTITKNVGTSSQPQMVVDQDATALAREKLQNLKDKFASWIWQDAARADRLAAKYNEEFNSTRERVFDGSHLTFPGSANVTMRKHQKNAVWRILRSPGNTLLAHVVGAGKTFEMVAAAMELRRLGLARKPMIVVPNHLVEQIGADFLRMYPTANVFIAGKEHFEAGKRQKAMSRIATGNYDAIIVAHNSFKALPVSDETFTSYLNEQLAELEDAILQMTGQAGKKDRTVKELEKAKKRLEVKIKERADRENKDDAITFEELGIDQLFVDEADLFKNLFFVTKMTRIAGLPNSESDRAFDMFIKTQHLQKMNNGRGVVFSTGTPIANTIAEMYTMQRYLQMPWLKEHGVAHFDAWAQSFGDSVTSMEVAPDGSGYRMNTRFARFVNVPELMAGFREVADIQTAAMLKLPTPKLAGGKNRVVAAPATDELKAYVQTLVHRSEHVKGGHVDPSVDNMLKITSDGRKAALDMRLVQHDAPDLPSSKVNLAVQDIHRIWKETADKRLTQLAFLDMSTPPAKGQRGKWNVYEDLKAKLVRMGVPAGEIAFIQHYKKDDEKLALFNAVNAGRIRILLGSTEMMGAGTNVQRLLVAEHHIDVPWRPRDLEQREGRILRQGNSNPEVQIINYVTEGSFDTYMYQTVEAKAAAIEQIMRGDSSVRAIEDVSGTALTAAEIKAISTGNPLIVEKAKIDAEVNRLSRLVAAYRNEQFGIRRQIADLPQEIANHKRMVDAMTADAAAAAEQGEPGFTIGKKLFSGDGARKAAAEALEKVLDSVRNDEAQHSLGKYGPFELRSIKSLFHKNLVYDLPGVLILGKWEYRANTNQEDPLGTIASIEAVVRGIPVRVTARTAELEDFEKKLADLKAQANKPNAHTAKLEELAKRQKAIFDQLDLDKADKHAAAAEEKPSVSGLLKEESGAVSLNLATLGLKKFAEQDVKPALIAAAKNLVATKDDILRMVAPAARGPLAKKMQGEIRYQAAELQRRIDQAEAALKDASRQLRKLPVAERFEFIDRIENGLPQPNLALQAIANMMRDMLDAARLEVQNLGTGKLESFYENYFPHIWKDAKAAAVTFASIVARRPLEGRKSFLKRRTIVTFADGLAAGLQPVSDDPVELVLAKLAEMNKYIMARHILEQAKAMGVVKFGRGLNKPKTPGDWREIADPIATVYGPRNNEGSATLRGRYWALEPAATLINNYLSPGLRGYASFRAYMGAGNVMLQFQLGWSAFHGTFVSLEAMTSRLALGNYQMAHGAKLQGAKSMLIGLTPITPFTTYQAGKKIQMAWDRPGSQPGLYEQMADAVVEAGGRARMASALHTQMTRGMLDAFRAGNILGGLVRAPFAMTEQAARPIMEYLVPRMKLGVYAQMAKFELERAGPGATPNQVRDALQRAWDSVDNRMGQLVYDNLGWNRIVKDLAMGTVRTVGWNLGDVRELGGGAVDLVKGGGRAARGRQFDLTPRAAYLLALPLVVGLYGGIMYYLLNGEAPRELVDYYYPKDGQGERLAMPSYIKEIQHFFHDPVATAKGKIHPMLTLIVDMLTNRDYFGRPIANADDPFVEKALALAKHAATAFEPISFQGLAPNEDETLKQKILPFVGFPRAPKYIGEDEAGSGSADLLGQPAARSRRDAELDRLLGR